MNTTKVEAESLLAVDVGTSNTRALLFDIAEGHFNFVASGLAASTVGAPSKNVNEGVRQALDSLQKVTGRILLGKDDRLVLPTQMDGSGVDALVATYSAGRPLNIVTVGLLPDVSLETAQRLANSTYAQVMENIPITDHRKPEVLMDAIIQARPDIILVAGGTDNGAGRSIARLVEVVGLACYLMPPENRPTVLYAGNATLAEKIKKQVEPITRVRIAPNIRPTIEQEELGPAEACLNEIVQNVRANQTNGLADLFGMTNGQAYSTAYAFGRIFRFLSKVYDPTKGVLGIDLGSASTVMAAAMNGKLALNVQTPLGMGEGISGVINRISPAEILQWSAIPFKPDEILDYLYQKQAYPNSLPVTAEEGVLNLAVARAILRHVVQGFAGRLIPPGLSLPPSLTPPYEPIIVCGATLTQAPSAGQSALTLLDGLQPVGVTTLVLDPNNLTPALGAAAGVNPLLPVQVLESGAYINLGTVVSPVSDAPLGNPILNARLVYEDNRETTIEVKHGSLHLLPLARGESALLYLEALDNTDLGMIRPGRGVKIIGGLLGAVIDARGRPLQLPSDAERRQELHKKWVWTLGG